MTDTPKETPEPEENEVLRETRAAKEAGNTARNRFGWKTAAAAAAAAGIGSAALAAALLYTNRNKN